MGWCFAPGCNHNENSECKKFKFPTDLKNQNIWRQLLECRSDRKPNKHTIICSCHFVDNKKENGPTIFAHNSHKCLSFSSPEKKRRRYRSREPLREVNPNELNDYNNNGPVTDNQQDQTKLIQSLRAEIEFLKNELKNQDQSELISSLNAEKEFLTNELDLEKKNKFGWDKICQNEELVKFYTGLPSKIIFLSLFDYLKDLDMKYYYGWTVRKISKENQLFITLIKLRLNLPIKHIATLFDCADTTITNIFVTWLYTLHTAVYKHLMSFPSQNKIKTCLPSAFSPFTNCRIIIDCTEVKIAIPHEMDKQRESYSSYKHSNTFKSLVGSAPNGVIIYASDSYLGSASDKNIVQTSGVLSHLDAGDLILADKGFLISDILPPGVNVNIPPFLANGQFTETEVQQTMSIARARIHIERAICRIKAFRIVNFISSSLKMHSSVIFQVCASLVNFQNPLIREVEEALLGSECDLEIPD